MSKTKFTPGPWVAMGPMPKRFHPFGGPQPVFPDGLWYILPEYNPERIPIAMLDHADDHCEPVRTQITPADARLIAAAPEMYAALTQAKEFIENQQLPDAEWARVLDVVVAARAKAVKP